MNEMRRYAQTIWENKTAALLVILIAAVVGSFFIQSGAAPALERGFAAQGGAEESFALSRDIIPPTDDATRGPSELQVKTGSASIDTDDAPGDMERLRSQATGIDGWVEDERKFESETELTIRATLKIPSDDFEDCVAWLRDNFNVEDSNFGFTRETTERQQAQIEILLDAEERYDTLLDRAESQEPSPEQTQTILEITKAKLEVTRLLQSYGYQVEQVERRADFATLYVTLTQEKEVEYVPEDLTRRLQLEVKGAIDSIATTGIEVLTFPFVLLVEVVKWVVAAVAVAVPAFFGYKIIRRLWKWLDKRF